jgi:alkanesulfonate monooxygenase SsuD/methylene tetrahydromethanopterin reductase-like flavin-dependent oxidoreductase (luciferase family)
MVRLPMVGLEADVAEIIESHLDVGLDDENIYVDGVEAAALAIVEELRSRGLVS